MINLNYRDSLFTLFFLECILTLYTTFWFMSPPHTQFNSLWLDARGTTESIQNPQDWEAVNSLPHSPHFVHSDHLWCVYVPLLTVPTLMRYIYIS